MVLHNLATWVDISKWSLWTREIFTTVPSHECSDLLSNLETLIITVTNYILKTKLNMIHHIKILPTGLWEGASLNKWWRTVPMKEYCISWIRFRKIGNQIFILLPKARRRKMVRNNIEKNRGLIEIIAEKDLVMLSPWKASFLGFKTSVSIYTLIKSFLDLIWFYPGTWVWLWLLLKRIWLCFLP